MRIVHAIRSDGFAGVESHVARLSVGQARAGHEVAVIGGEPGAMSHAMDDVDLPRRPAATVLEVVRAIDAWRDCDILHVHMTAAEFAALMAVRALSRPVVTTRHFAGHRGASGPGALAAPLIAHRVAAQIAISAFVAAAIEGASTVVHPGLPTAALVPGRARDRTVLVVQRLEAEKRTQDAIEVFARSGIVGSGWRLAIAGEGSQRADLERLARRLGVETSTSFLGYRQDVQELMRAAGVLVAPCDIEGFGLTVLEAMSVGLPVVACGAGGHLETVGATPGGILYPPSDLQSAATALRELVDDVSGRAAYGERLREVQSTRFTVEAQVEATDAVYRSVL